MIMPYLRYDYNLETHVKTLKVFSELKGLINIPISFMGVPIERELFLFHLAMEDCGLNPINSGLRSPVLPGSSIGIKGFDGTSSLSLFFKHRGIIYGLASGHLFKDIDPNAISSKLEVVHPSDKDAIEEKRQIVVGNYVDHVYRHGSALDFCIFTVNENIEVENKFDSNPMVQIGCEVEDICGHFIGRSSGQVKVRFTDVYLARFENELADAIIGISPSAGNKTWPGDSGGPGCIRLKEGNKTSYNCIGFVLGRFESSDELLFDLFVKYSVFDEWIKQKLSGDIELVY